MATHTGHEKSAVCGLFAATASGKTLPGIGLIRRNHLKTFPGIVLLSYPHWPHSLLHIRRS